MFFYYYKLLFQIHSFPVKAGKGAHKHKHKHKTSENTKHKHKDIRKRRIDKTADEVKYCVLSCSFFNNFGLKGIAEHLSDPDRDVGTFLLEQKPVLRKRACIYLSFEPRPTSYLFLLSLKLCLSYYMALIFHFLTEISAGPPYCL